MASAVPEHSDEARFLQRLVRFPALRERYLQDPVGTARAEGLPVLARELARADAGLEPLEERESRSSLAGFFTSLAVEGVVAFGALEDHFGAEAAAAAVPRHQRDEFGSPALADELEAGEDEEDHDPGEDVDEDGEDSPDDDDEDVDEDGEDSPDDDEDDADDDGEDSPDDDDEDDADDDEDDSDDEDESDSSDDDSDDDEDDADEGPDVDDDGEEPNVGGSDSDDPNDVLERHAGSAVDGAPVDYPGDEAPREQIAAWMARAAKERGLPPELPVMASLVESGLQNLSYGDADSVGFFQMRTSIWDQGEYAGYARRPELQLEWFLDHAEAMGEQRVARGQPVDDPARYGEWIADVERPAAQFRGRYQLRLDEARDVLAAFNPPEAVPAAGERAAAALDVREVDDGHALQVGRRDARGGLRLLRPCAVGLREGGDLAAARDRPAVRRAGRRRGQAPRPAPGRPGLLPRLHGLRAPRRDVTRRRPLRRRAPHGRRGSHRQPEGPLLGQGVRRRAPLRPGARTRARRGARAARGDPPPLTLDAAP